MHINLKQKSNKKIDMHKIFTKLVGICIHSNNIKNTTLEFGKMYLQIANQNLAPLLA
jgi:hypothetical protein